MKSALPAAVLSAAAGIAGLWLLLRGMAAAASGCHALAAGFGWYAASVSDSRRLGFHSFHAALSICAPFFGGATAFLLSESVKRKKTGSLAHEFAVYLNDAASFRESVPVADAEPPPVESLSPLFDVLIGESSESEQRIAVENLVSMETPAAMDVLRRAVEINRGEGRFLAMTALGQMEEKLLAKLQDREEFIASGRDSGPAPLIEAASAYVDFVYYRLATDARRGDYLARAGELLEAALVKRGCPDDAWLRLGRVRLMQYDGRAALSCFDSYLEARPGDPSGLIWKAEAWYALGDYERVRGCCREASMGGGAPPAIRASVEFWLDGENGTGAQNGGAAGNGRARA